MIKKLDSFTIDKIAAGEVIERPSSVVKELLENAIDSNATSIVVSIKEGGLTEITVSDNGNGIDSQDLPVCVLRHATSKITSFEDLEDIDTLGFRGEALASISSVSKFQIISKTSNNNAWIYEINGNKEIRYEECAGTNGTKVVVKELFYNVPARLKFVKSVSTETSYITKIVQIIALSHPEVSFKYNVDTKTKLFTSGSNDLSKCIYEIYGKSIADNGQIIDITDNNISLYGFLGNPDISKSNRSLEITFVNNRYINNLSINRAIEEGYRSVLMERRYPVAILFININPNCVDVNIHPTKSDVRFSNSNYIFGFINNSIHNQLINDSIIHNINVKDSKPSNHIDLYIDEMKKRVEAKYNENFGHIFSNNDSNISNSNISTITANANNVEQSQINFVNNNSNDLASNVRIIGQLFRTYWLVEYQDNMLLIDQHAAHEKILYEKLLSKYQNQEFNIQVVEPPILINMPIEDESFIKTYMQIFEKFGFEIESVGDNDYLLRGVPYELSGINSKELFEEFANELFDNKMLSPTPRKLKEKLAMSACKAAVKGNNNLNEIEIKQILIDLMKLENPYNCPHGRPTMIKMSRNEIEKHFGRIV